MELAGAMRPKSPNRTNPPNPPTLELLPIELKQAIMSALPDVWSLKSIALTTSSLYCAFIDAEVLITSQVLLNEVEFDVLPEAAAALESSRLKPWTRQRIQDFVSQHLHTRRPPPQNWTLSDALLVSKLYDHVHYFAAGLASKTLASPPPSSSPKPDQAPLSRNEITRIIRAFYRFEIYCNLFRDPEHTLFNLEEQPGVFFSNFSLWENEQLTCVHDYLCRVVSPAFNDISEHDIEWGEFSVEYGDRIDSWFIQHLLSLGLAYLHRIVLAETYEARYRLLHSNCPCPSFNNEFLYEGLKTANEHDDAVCLADYTQDEELAHIKSPFIQDSDSGPTDAWRWAHQDETCANFLNSDSQGPLREWGYVMWDRARLDKWDIFQTPWETPDTSASAGEETQRMAERHASFRRRSKIYWAGGRGWWSLGDESKIIWLHKETTWDSHTGRRGPLSRIP